MTGGYLMDMMNSVDQPYGLDLDRLTAVLLFYQQCKDAGYGCSWAKRGELGIYMNLMRKADRMDKLVPLVLSGEHDGVALVDTLADMVLYGMMWLSYIAAKRPSDIENWVRSTFCKETGLDEQMVLALLFGVED